MTDEKTTGTLTSILKHTAVERVDDFFREHQNDMAPESHPFAAYMREQLRLKNLAQTALFVRAGVPERYGYKLLSEEKHTRRRDVILRLCFAAQFSFEQTQRALRLYEMPPLYPRQRRDALLISLLAGRIFSLSEVDERLRAHGFAPLEVCGSTDEIAD